MQIPISVGTYTDTDGNYRVSYPHNLSTIPQSQGISIGYLKPHEGVVENGAAPGDGVIRGGINWNSVIYRVAGSSLISEAEDGTVVVLGDVGDDSRPVRFHHSFDDLSITSNNDLFYYNPIDGLRQVTDPDLGDAIDHIWIDGYFMTTDGEFLVVTEIDDPTAVDPLKYGSSELDPDPVLALLKLRNEPYALNRYTIETFQNVGGTGFPFQVVQGAQIQRGCVGTYMCSIYMERIAFVGSGRNEALSVWVSSGGQSIRIANREIDLMLQKYDEVTLSNLVMETRSIAGQELLYIHLPDISLVYDGKASALLKRPVWNTLGSGVVKNSPFLARYFVWCYDRWNVGDPSGLRVGYLSESVGSHWGDKVLWQFSTDIMYNEGLGALIHELELEAITGNNGVSDDSQIATQYSVDGLAWSQKRRISIGSLGNRNQRLRWLMQGHLQHKRIQRFEGDSDAKLSFSRLNVRVEPLEV